jgi:molybdopterin/thiamine biosynthesis adenylyltransferase
MSTAPVALTSKETEIYDRQLRLWGVEAQQRMRGARVYIAGLSGIGTEVTKNLVLAGVSVTLLDSQVVTPAHLSVNFFLGGEGSVGMNVRALGGWLSLSFSLSFFLSLFASLKIRISLPWPC